MVPCAFAVEAQQRPQAQVESAGPSAAGTDGARFPGQAHANWGKPAITIMIAVSPTPLA
ncbi:MAG TPA: hypothetical protein VGY58_21165 [Gemmataceae bacterium]|nr:hypothetical protein [Gemmataceae bacterium]